MLKPALRRLWRDPTTLQLGVDPASAVVLTGMAPGEVDLLDLLDGHHDVPGVVAVAGQRGVEPGRVHDLVAVLRGAGALEENDSPDGCADPRREPDALSLSLLHPRPGAVMQRRRAGSVTVYGAGRVGATIANLLAAAGLGVVDVVDAGGVRPGDLAPGGIREPGRGSMRAASRASAVEPSVRSWTTRPPGPACEPGPTTTDRPTAAVRDVAVLAPVAPVPPPEQLAAIRHRIHLCVLVRDTTAVVGPLVVPGVSPCLRCLELARGDRDPAWPALSAQVLSDPRRTEPCDVVLATLAASLAALQVLTAVDGDGVPPARGAILEFGLHDMRLRRRAVQPHPGCGCGADR